jgi:N-acetylmuramoyl-L-alanine amidase-like protein
MTLYLTDLADVIRANTGLTVIEEPGWKTRGHGPMLTRPQAIICHHTGAPASSYRTNPYPSLKTVRDGRNLGRPDELKGPLAQIGLQRDRKVRVIAAGLCYHAGVVFEDWMSNGHTLGIEAEHDGVSGWPDDLYSAYVELCAGLVRGYSPPHGVQAHKEVARPKGRKNDPNFPMGPFRTAVASFSKPTEEDDMAGEGAAIIKLLQAKEAADAARYKDIKNAITAWLPAKLGQADAADKVRDDKLAADVDQLEGQVAELLGKLT